MQKVLSVKVFECKSFDAKAMNAEIVATLVLLLRGRLARIRIHSATYFFAATARLLLRRPSRKNALYPVTYLWMCQRTPGIHRLVIFKLHG